MFSVDCVFSGINIDDRATLVPTPQEGFGVTVETIFEGFQTLLCWEDIVLKATECRLPGSAIKLFPHG